MKPLSLRLRNCRTFSDFILDLPEGLLAILGANGAGKSTIIDAIDIALFGPHGRSLADWYPRAGGDEPLVIELTFEHQGHEYRVRRSFSPKGRGVSKLDFEEGDGGISDFGGGRLPSSDWRPLTVESQTATQAEIELIIGLSRDTFRASSFVGQNDSGAFCEALPGQRKAIFADMLGLDQWMTWLERARTEKKRVTSEIDQLVGGLERSEQELAERERTEQERIVAMQNETLAKNDLAETQTKLQCVRDEFAELKQKADERGRTQRDMENAQAEVEKLERKIDERNAELTSADEALAARGELEEFVLLLPDHEREYASLASDIEQWRERLRLEQEQQRHVRDEINAVARAVELEEKATQVLATVGEEHCDRCGQVLHADAAQRAHDSYIDEAAGFRKAAAEAEEAAGGISSRLIDLPAVEPDAERYAQLPAVLKDLRAAREALAALDERQKRRDELVREIESLRAELPDRQRVAAGARLALDTLGPHDPAAMNALTIEADNLFSLEKQLTGGAEHWARQVARLDERLERLDKIAAGVELARSRRDALQHELAVYIDMERACGANGVPALILETVAIPQVETEASRILGLLGGPAYAVELRTLKETKSGTVADTLDIVLLTVDGDRSYESFSGGEQTRIAFAIRLAFAQLLASRRGTATDLLVIDEPGGLDGHGMAALVGILEDLATRIRTILIVSHDAQLRDAFERTLQLENIDGRSRAVEEVVA